MSRELAAREFERQYAERSGMTVEQLRQHKTVRPCDCDYESCEGWQCVLHSIAAEIDDPAIPWVR